MNADFSQNSPIPLEAHIQNANNALSRVIESRTSREHGGRFYIVIDPETQMLGITKDRTLASPMEKVAEKLQQLSTQIRQEAPTAKFERKDVKTFASNVKNFVKIYNSYTRRISHFFASLFSSRAKKTIENTSTYLEKAQENLRLKIEAPDERVHDYGFKTYTEKPKVRTLLEVDESDLTKPYEQRVKKKKIELLKTHQNFQDVGKKKISQENPLETQDDIENFLHDSLTLSPATKDSTIEKLINEMSTSALPIINKALDHALNATANEVEDGDKTAEQAIEAFSNQLKASLKDRWDQAIGERESENQRLGFLGRPEEFQLAEKIMDEVAKNENNRTVILNYFKSIEPSE